MRATAKLVLCLAFALPLTGCGSPWKIHGGPRECTQICRNWNMELTGMVGVGNQDRTGAGATACVCQVRKNAAANAETDVAASGTAASTAAVVVALQEEERRRQEQSRKK